MLTSTMLYFSHLLLLVTDHVFWALTWTSFAHRQHAVTAGSVAVRFALAGQHIGQAAATEQVQRRLIRARVARTDVIKPAHHRVNEHAEQVRQHRRVVRAQHLCNTQSRRRVVRSQHL